MGVEDLLKMLRDGGLDDEAIKGLLSEALASLDGAAEGKPAATETPTDDVEAEKAEAGKYLGVNL